MPSVQEYRRHKRVTNQILTVGLFDDGRRMPEVSVNDVSLGGMGITIQDRVEEGQELVYSVLLPGGEVQGRAVVRWVQPFAAGYRSGIEFTNLGFWDKHRLNRYLGNGFKFALPDRVSHFLDKALWLGTLAVAAMVVIDMVGLTPKDLLDLAVLAVW